MVSDTLALMSPSTGSIWKKVRAATGPTILYVTRPLGVVSKSASTAVTDTMVSKTDTPSDTTTSADGALTKAGRPVLRRMVMATLAVVDLLKAPRSRAMMRNCSRVQLSECVYRTTLIFFSFTLFVWKVLYHFLAQSEQPATIVEI